MAVAVDDFETDTTGGGNMTWPHTVAGSDRAMLHMVGQRFGSNGVTGTTYNAAALTKLYELDNGFLTSSIIYRLLSPATGAHDNVVNQADARALLGTSLSLTGVDQTMPEGPIAHNVGHDAAPTLTVTSAVNDLVVALVTWYRPATETMVVAGGGHTEITNLNVSTMGGIVSTKAGASSVTLDWTASLSVYWNAAAFSVKAGGAGAGGSPLSAALQMLLMADGG